MKIIKSIILYLNFFRFLPHFMFYVFSKNRYLILEDLNAYKTEYKMSSSNWTSLLSLLFHNRSFRTLFYHRLGEYRWFINFLAPGMQHLSLTKTPIGGGFLMFHAYCTIIDAVSVGKNCRIVNNITIGFKNGLKATIKDNVEIYANAVIVGDIIIGNNCVIGPGAVVHKSIPDNCVVVGNPAYILKQDGVIVNKKL